MMALERPRYTRQVVSAVAGAGRIDVLINNAGVTNTKAALDQSENRLDFIVDTI